MYDSVLFPEPRYPSFRYGRRSQREAPKEVQDRLTKAGGLNRFGGPNFRLIWGWANTNTVYNRHTREYERRPRYMLKKRDRWFLEKWFAPEFYGTPRMWRRQFTENIDGRAVDLLGPFPERGEYEQLLTIETWHKPECPTQDKTDCECGGMSYLDLSLSVVDEIVKRAEAARDENAWARKYRHEEANERRNKNWEDLADDTIKDLQRSYLVSPTVFLGHRNVLKGKYEGGK